VGSIFYKFSIARGYKNIKEETMIYIIAIWSIIGAMQFVHDWEKCLADTRKGIINAGVSEDHSAFRAIHIISLLLGMSLMLILWPIRVVKQRL